MRANCRNAAVLGVCVATACLWPPAVALPHLLALALTGFRAWTYCCSVVLGAAPYILVGVAAGAVIQQSMRRGPSGRLARYAPLAGALLSPGCDCSMNGLAPAMRALPPPLAGFAFVWGACCGPAALIATHAALGDRMLWVRIVGGFCAAALTAVLWTRTARPSPLPRPCDGHAIRSVDHLARAFGPLCIAAAVAGICQAFWPGALAHMHSPLGAAAIGALLSPCATSDPLLARALSGSPADQAAFIVAAQCLDMRQLGLLRQHFGAPRMALAAAAGTAGCWLAALLA
ncbi:MAG: hypothetical protein M3T49_07650 [Candidatus Eremiobacteraeota bacterium]|nr:hypothetical protein [Candidatus Eremiobacteraeota bacterium]